MTNTTTMSKHLKSTKKARASVTDALDFSRIIYNPSNEEVFKMRTQEEIKRISDEIRINTRLKIIDEERKKTIDKIREYANKPRAQLMSPVIIGEILRVYDKRSRILRAQLSSLNCEKALNEYRKKVTERL